MYAFGVGEIAISVSGVPTAADETITHTIRSVGAVSRALHDAQPGTVIGMRGPFGTSWGLAEAAAAIWSSSPEESGWRRFGRWCSARWPSATAWEGDTDRRRPVSRRLPVRRGTPDWAQDGSLDVHLTVDVPVQGWPGEVGFVTEPLRRIPLRSERHDRIPVRAGADDAQRRQRTDTKGLSRAIFACPLNGTCSAGSAGAGTASSARCCCAATGRSSATTSPSRCCG